MYFRPYDNNKGIYNLFTATWYIIIYIIYFTASWYITIRIYILNLIGQTPDKENELLQIVRVLYFCRPFLQAPDCMH